jgi:hypothetical protein
MKMKPFDPNTEFLGKTLLSSILGLPGFTQKNMFRILEQKGIKQLDSNTWYILKIALDFYTQVNKDFGPNTIFNLGKAVPENAIFPPDIDSIESALQLIDVAYNMNHRNGYFGFYKMVSHDLEEKKIIMQCYTPYLCDFDRGLLTAMARKFKSGVRVFVDEDRPSKKKGGNESWYIITYR